MKYENMSCNCNFQDYNILERDWRIDKQLICNISETKKRVVDLLTVDVDIDVESIKCLFWSCLCCI